MYIPFTLSTRIDCCYFGGWGVSFCGWSILSLANNQQVFRKLLEMMAVVTASMMMMTMFLSQQVSI